MITRSVGPKDDLDRNIIRELQTNARESTTNIAAKLKVARSTVHERILRLEKEGVIKGYTAVLAKNSDEARVEALIMLAIKQQETRRVLDTLPKFSEIRLCLSINGEFDLFLSAVASQVEDLELVIDEIAKIPGVLRTQTSIVFNTKFDRRYDEIASKISDQIA